MSEKSVLAAEPFDSFVESPALKPDFYVANYPFQTSSQTSWKEKILKYLNFVSEQTFKSLEDAGLMAKVDQKLEKAIDAYGDSVVDSKCTQAFFNSFH